MKMFKVLGKVALILGFVAMVFSCGEVAEGLKTLTAQEKALNELRYLATGNTAVRIWSSKKIGMNIGGYELNAAHQLLSADGRLAFLELGSPIMEQPDEKTFSFSSVWYLEQAGAENEYHIRHGQTGQYLHIQWKNDAAGTKLQSYWGAGTDHRQTVFTAKADAEGHISFTTDNGNAITLNGVSETHVDSDRITSFECIDLQPFIEGDGQKFTIEKLPLQPRIWGGKCYLKNGIGEIEGETRDFYLKADGTSNGSTLSLITDKNNASIWWITMDGGFTSYSETDNTLTSSTIDFSINLDGTEKYIHINGGNYSDSNTVVLWDGTGDGDRASNSNGLFTFPYDQELRGFWYIIDSGKSNLVMAGYDGNTVRIRDNNAATYANYWWGPEYIWN